MDIEHKHNQERREQKQKDKNKYKEIPISECNECNHKCSVYWKYKDIKNQKFKVLCKRDE